MKKRQGLASCRSRWRSLAESNRRRRFCRPLTKPLIQGTFCSLLRVQSYNILCNFASYLADFFASQHLFLVRRVGFLPQHSCNEQLAHPELGLLNFAAHATISATTATRIAATRIYCSVRSIAHEVGDTRSQSWA